MKKGRILLISPNLRGVDGGINRIQPGLGVGYLAAVLEREGHEVYIRDTALEGHSNKILQPDGQTILIGETDEQIASFISDLKPDIVGISVLFSNLAEHAHTVARIIKEVNPAIHVVMGGNHTTNATSDYEFSMVPGNDGFEVFRASHDIEDPNIDYAMAGECDFAFAELVQALLEGSSPNAISGLIYHKDGRIVVNPRPPRADITKLPHPARHLMNMEGYFKIGLFHSTKSLSSRVLNVMASRGCPEVCTFCTTPEMWGAKVRWREPQDIFEEIRSGIEQFGIEEVQFEDDTLTANRPHLMELCDLIEPLEIPWCTPNGTKVNYHLKKQPSMFRRMKEAGCYQITLACETGVQRIMDDVIKKNLLLEEIQPAIENAKGAGLLVHTFWIVGFPGETREEMERTIEFASHSGADSYTISILNPLPGTPNYRHVVKNNLWWDPNRGIRDMLFRNSLIQTDGFSSSDEFQGWVNKQNIYLNGLVAINNPERAALVRSIRGAQHVDDDAFKVKQT
ncbi:MAG: radical SAM protein [Candidatus Nitrohelix vancouverensis]|uniref:Radical SAM protein n=1 Tax=Candidatus Nitrohelix vancouverensis TaxID=2705534 RepID=A0A7T0G2N7_9BACT|nr:MAG: radical SAM protein [Candidatus Nitrohelix vancouverensis]